MTDLRPVKHSLTLRGHRTSVSLEPEFWEAFRAIARREGVALNELAAQIDAGRSNLEDTTGRGAERGLASAIRVFVLTDLQNRDGQSSE